jgi:hypothetical protein
MTSTQVTNLVSVSAGSGGGGMYLNAVVLFEIISIFQKLGYLNVKFGTYL